MVDTLKPVKAAIESFGREATNLAKSDAILSFTLNQLLQQNTSPMMESFYNGRTYFNLSYSQYYRLV